jgi:hypothetical protein
MSATAMHFGPEWMRTKPAVQSRVQAHPPSPPPSGGTSSYSALVSSAPTSALERRDETHPFRYSKEELLRIYKEGGRKTGLALEVERWEGVVKEVASEPIGLREMDEAERKVSVHSLLLCQRLMKTQCLPRVPPAFFWTTQLRAQAPPVDGRHFFIGHAKHGTAQAESQQFCIGPG